MSEDHATNQLIRYNNLIHNNNLNNTLTTASGAPLSTITSSMTAGRDGPILLQDHGLIDHLSHFDHERIPERVVHAKGAGAHGIFEVTTNEAKKYCKAKVFDGIGKRVPIFVRFSTVGGESGSADTARDPRGFAIKFYTEEGNWDLVGNNTPIFFIRDPILFPSFIHTQKRNPQTHCKDPNMFWDFISLRPETTHQVSFLFSDRGLPDGYRHMNGYGSHTFKNVNSKGEIFFVKYHLKTDQGIRNLTNEEANELASSDPDYSIRDLYNSIAEGNFPSWTVYLQVMTYEDSKKMSFNPFDVTKIWPHSLFPLIEIGRITLNRNPENYFAEVEQAAFCPSHMIPGIEPSPDKMLNGRLFSYSDTHRHRLGVNYQQLPINQPINTRVKNYQRDGQSQFNNQTGTPNYFPNSFSGPKVDMNAEWHHETVSGKIAQYNTADEDNFSQVNSFYNNVLSDEEKERLTDNIASNLIGAADFIQRRAISNFRAVDPNYGEKIEKKIHILKNKRTNDKKKREPAPLNPPRKVPRARL